MTRPAQRPLGIAAAAAAALAVLVAGCGEGRNYGSATSASSPPTTSPAPAARPGLTVTEREFAISPRDVRVDSAGTTAIAIRNNGTVEHALEVKGPTGDVRTAAIAPGASAQLKVDLSKPGSYTWYCPIDGHARAA